MSRSARPPGGLTPSKYFFRKRIFTIEEFLDDHPRHTRETATAVLAYYVKVGILWRVKRGLYQDTDSVDTIAVAARWTRDAVLAYEGALWLHTPESRRSESPPALAVLTRSKCDARWENERRVIFPVRAPSRLECWDLSSIPWEGGPVRATTFERTVVDLLDRMDLCPPIKLLWEELAHHRPKATPMIDHALALGNRTACARLGFLLQHLPGTTAEDLARLPVPARPAYFDARTRKEDHQQYRSQWKLMVPLRWAHCVAQTDFYREYPRFTEIKDPQW